MSRVAAWNGAEWVNGIASQAEQRERWRSGGRRWVSSEDIYGTAQVEEGWHALWELTEARCVCGAIEVVAWRPGHRNGKHGSALLRVQAVECWQCGEVVDLRLERRDRQAEEQSEDDRIQAGLRVLHGDFVERKPGRPGRWVSSRRNARRRSVVGSRRIAHRPGVPPVKVAPVQVVEAVVDKAARRAEAVKKARAHHGGERFVVGALAAWLSGLRG